MLLAAAIVGEAYHLVDTLHQSTSGTAHAAYVHLAERAVVAKRNSGMVEQEAVAHQVERSVAIEHTQVFLHLLRLTERARELVHQVLLLLAESIRIGRIKRRQVGIQKRVLGAVERDDATTEVDQVQQCTMVHTPLGVTTYGLPLQLELDDGDGLVHLSHQLGTTRQAGVVLKVARLPYGAVVVAVGLHGEVGKRQQVDTIALFQRFDIRIADGDAQDGSDECLVAQHSAHPLDVVVAPLDVVVAHGGEHVQYLAGARSTVEDVTYDMQGVDGERMDEIGYLDEQLFGAAGLDDGVDDGVVVVDAVALLQVRLMEQLLDNIAILAG